MVGIAVVYVLYQRVLSPEPLALVLLAVGWLGGLTLAALGAGGLVRRWLPQGNPAEVFVLRLAAGAAVLTLGAMALGVAGLLSKWVLGLILLGSVALGIPQVRRFWGGWAVPPPRPSLPWLLLIPGAAVSLLAACVPSNFYDQLNYHLALPFHWLRLGELAVFPRQAYSFLPAYTSLLYTYALAVLPPWSAQLLHWWMGAVAVALVALLAIRVGGKGGWAAAFFAGAPLVVRSATWAASDLAVACYAAAAWLALLLALERESTGSRLVVAGALAGFAAGSKLLALATVVGPLGLGAVSSAFFLPGPHRRWRTGLVRGLWVAAGTLLTLSPWWVRSFLLTGNPLYPAFSDSPVGGGVSVGGLLNPFSSWSGLVSWAQKTLPRVLLGTFSPEGEGGLVGPIFLALLPMVALWVAVRPQGPRLLLLVGFLAGVVGWAFLPPLPRYLLGALVPGAVLAGAGVAQLVSWWPARVSRWLQAVLGFGVWWGSLGGLSPEVMMRVGVALGQMDQERWMTQAVDYWTAARYINGELPATARLLLVAEARTMYLERDVVVDDPFRTPLLAELADASPTPDAMARTLADMGVTHCLINWREAQRMAALNRREAYLAPASARGRENLAAFLAGWLVPVFRDGPVEVYALRSHPAGGAR